MTQPLPPSRSSFDKTSLQEVINRYGWTKNSPDAAAQARPATARAVPPAPLSSAERGARKTGDVAGPAMVVPVPAADDAGLKEELSAARKKIGELTEALTEKESQLDIVSRQCEELKERGDEFEKSAFKENGELLTLKSQLSEKEGLLQQAEQKIKTLEGEISSGAEKSDHAAGSVLELEKKLKEREEKARKESDVLLGRIAELSSQLTVEGGGTIQELLAKYKQQLKQGADLLKQSMAECRRLEVELKGLQASATEWGNEKQVLLGRLDSQATEPKPSPELEAKVDLLQTELLETRKKLQDAEAHAANSQAAVSHAMDFAYKATQDNELMKKKLHEAGIRF